KFSPEQFVQVAPAHGNPSIVASFASKLSDKASPTRAGRRVRPGQALANTATIPLSLVWAGRAARRGSGPVRIVPALWGWPRVRSAQPGRGFEGEKQQGRRSRRPRPSAGGNGLARAKSAGA